MKFSLFNKQSQIKLQINKKFTSFLWLSIFSLIFSLFMSLILSTFAYSSEKIVKIRAPQKHHFSADIKPVKPYFNVNKSIELKIKANQDFYLYLINYDEQKKQAIALLPNKYQKQRIDIQYAGNKWHTIPGKKIEFYSDKPGKERVFMFASQKYINIEKLLKKTSSKSLGDFYLMEADPLAAFEQQINIVFGLNITKQIQIRNPESHLPRGMVIKELHVLIK